MGTKSLKSTGCPTCDAAGLLRRFLHVAEERLVDVEPAAFVAWFREQVAGVAPAYDARRAKVAPVASDDVLASARRTLEGALQCGCRASLTLAQTEAVVLALGGSVTL
jgi:hypothetical protein